MRSLRIDGEAPQAAAVLRIVEGAFVIDAHYRADHLPGLLLPRPKVDDLPRLVPAGGETGIDRGPAPRGVGAVGRGPLLVRVEPHPDEAPRQPGRGAEFCYAHTRGGEGGQG